MSDTALTQEAAHNVIAWNWQMFEASKPEIQVCIREKKRHTTPTPVKAIYEVNERGGYKWVDIEFQYVGFTYYFSVHQFEISACLNAPQRYEPALNAWLKEQFYSVTLKLA